LPPTSAAWVAAVAGVGTAMLLSLSHLRRRRAVVLTDPGEPRSAEMAVSARGATADPRPRQASSSEVMLISGGRSPSAEAFRTVRTHVLLLAQQTGLRHLLITSTGPREGKTTVAANVAAVPVAGLVMLYGLPAGMFASLLPGWLQRLVMAPAALGTRWTATVAQVGAALEPSGVAAVVAWCIALAVLAFSLFRGHRSRSASRLVPF